MLARPGYRIYTVVHLPVRSSVRSGMLDRGSCMIVASLGARSTAFSSCRVRVLLPSCGTFVERGICPCRYQSSPVPQGPHRSIIGATPFCSDASWQDPLHRSTIRGERGPALGPEPTGAGTRAGPFPVWSGCPRWCRVGGVRHMIAVVGVVRRLVLQMRRAYIFMRRSHMTSSGCRRTTGSAYRRARWHARGQGVRISWRGVQRES